MDEGREWSLLGLGASASGRLGPGAEGAAGGGASVRLQLLEREVWGEWREAEASRVGEGVVLPSSWPRPHLRGGAVRGEGGV